MLREGGIRKGKINYPAVATCLSLPRAALGVPSASTLLTHFWPWEGRGALKGAKEPAPPISPIEPPPARRRRVYYGKNPPPHHTASGEPPRAGPRAPPFFGSSWPGMAPAFVPAFREFWARASRAKLGPVALRTDFWPGAPVLCGKIPPPSRLEPPRARFPAPEKSRAGSNASQTWGAGACRRRNIYRFLLSSRRGLPWGKKHCRLVSVYYCSQDWTATAHLLSLSKAGERSGENGSIQSWSH